jgi:WD40 repeat protein
MVSSVAVGTIAGRDVIISGSWDNTVRVWDPTGGCLSVLPIGDRVEQASLAGTSLAVACPSGVLVVELRRAAHV